MNTVLFVNANICFSENFFLVLNYVHETSSYGYFWSIWVVLYTTTRLVHTSVDVTQSGQVQT